MKSSLLKCANKGTPLSREVTKDYFQIYVPILSAKRQLQVQFRENRPLEVLIKRFIELHPRISLKRRANLESRAVTMRWRRPTEL